MGILDMIGLGGGEEAKAPTNATLGALQRMGYKDPGSRGEGINIPLLMAGASMASAKTPFFGTALGEGLKAGGESLMMERQADIARETARADLLNKALGNMKAVSDYNMVMARRGNPSDLITPLQPGNRDPNGPKGADGAPVASLSGNPSLFEGGKAGRAAAYAEYSKMDPDELLALGELYSSNQYVPEFGKTLLEMGKARQVAQQKMVGEKGLLVLGKDAQGNPIYMADPSIAAANAELKGAEEGFLVGPDGKMIDYLGPAKAQRAAMVTGAEKAQSPVETMDTDPNSKGYGTKKLVYPKPPGAAGVRGTGAGTGAGPDGLPTSLPAGEPEKITAAQKTNAELGKTVADQTIAEGKLKSTADMFKLFSSGRWQEHKAEISEGLRSIFGDEKAESYSRLLDTDPAAVQKIAKDAVLTSFSQVKDSLGGSRFAASEIQMMNKATAEATKNPATAHMILSDALAVIQRHRDAYNALMDENTGETARRNPEAFLARWSQDPANSYEKYKKQSAEQLGLFAGMKDEKGNLVRPKGAVPEAPPGVLPGAQYSPSRRAFRNPDGTIIPVK
jgi:hypothetical protein